MNKAIENKLGIIAIFLKIIGYIGIVIFLLRPTGIFSAYFLLPLFIGYILDAALATKYNKSLLVISITMLMIYIFILARYKMHLHF